MGHASAEIHSNLSPAQRRDALGGFKSGKYRILVATDIASRGIDVNDIALVINYDLPDNNEDYVHRIGRTGRAGQAGHAITLATPDQRQDVRRIESIIRATIPLAAHPDLPSEQFYQPAPTRGRGGRRGPASSQPVARPKLMY
jgi:ATP-dependent RNA helicase RhlE